MRRQRVGEERETTPARIRPALDRPGRAGVPRPHLERIGGTDRVRIARVPQRTEHDLVQVILGVPVRATRTHTAGSLASARGECRQCRCEMHRRPCLERKELLGGGDLDASLQERFVDLEQEQLVPEARLAHRGVVPLPHHAAIGASIAMQRPGQGPPGASHSSFCFYLPAGRPSPSPSPCPSASA